MSHTRKLRPGEVEVASSGCLSALEFCRGPEPGYVGYEKVHPVVRRSGVRRRKLRVGLLAPWSWASVVVRPASAVEPLELGSPPLEVRMVGRCADTKVMPEP